MTRAYGKSGTTQKREPTRRQFPTAYEPDNYITNCRAEIGRAEILWARILNGERFDAPERMAPA